MRHVHLIPGILAAAVFPLAIFAPTAAGQTDQAIPLVERFEEGAEYRVDTRVTLEGKLLVPVEKDKPPKQMSMHGVSTIDYDERILPVEAKTADAKTVRLYRTIDFKRKNGDTPQEISLRPDVRRLVVMKKGRAKVPFSPSGPLTWGEIDMLRTDIFVPALRGLLPINPVKPSDSWKVSQSTVIELTDLEKIERGSLTCTYVGVTINGGRKYADVTFEGDLRGINEDGPNRQILTGRFYFDLQASMISYLSIKGEHFLLDKDNSENGRISGEFTMTRRPNPHNPQLTDAVLSKVNLEPNADNTMLLYEEPEVGVSLVYPRRWRVGRSQTGQITLDESNGSGLLITLDFPDKIPTTAAYVKEANSYLQEQSKAQIIRQTQAVRLAPAPKELDQFGFEVQMGGQRVFMDYLIARQANAGATFAARLLNNDREALIREVEQIARSLTLSRKFEKK